MGTRVFGEGFLKGLSGDLIGIKVTTGGAGGGGGGGGGGVSVEKSMS